MKNCVRLSGVKQSNNIHKIFKKITTGKNLCNETQLEDLLIIRKAIVYLVLIKNCSKLHGL